MIQSGTIEFTSDPLSVLDDCWGTQLACTVGAHEVQQGVDYGSVSLDVPIHAGEEVWIYVSQSIDRDAFGGDPPPPSLIIEQAPSG